MGFLQRWWQLENWHKFLDFHSGIYYYINVKQIYFMAYHHEWSQSYIKGLTFEEHHVNNEWFNNMLAMLKDDGELYVPMLDKSFNKSGEEVSS